MRDKFLLFCIIAIAGGYCFELGLNNLGFAFVLIGWLIFGAILFEVINND